MPRATEPKPSVGGAMAPGVLESAGRGRALAENRLLEAMRQSGASERGKMQAQAQVQTAQIGAGSRREVAAMQEAEADRRAAEAIKGKRIDHEHQMNVVKLHDQLASERDIATGKRREVLFDKLSIEFAKEKQKDRYSEEYGAQLEHDTEEESIRIMEKLADTKLRTEKEKRQRIEADIEVTQQQIQNRRMDKNVREEIRNLNTLDPVVTTPEAEMAVPSYLPIISQLKNLDLGGKISAESFFHPGLDVKKSIATQKLREKDLETLYILRQESEEHLRELYDQTVESGEKIGPSGWGEKVGRAFIGPSYKGSKGSKLRAFRREKLEEMSQAKREWISLESCNDPIGKTGQTVGQLLKAARLRTEKRQIETDPIEGYLENYLNRIKDETSSSDEILEIIRGRKRKGRIIGDMDTTGWPKYKFEIQKRYESVYGEPLSISEEGLGIGDPTAQWLTGQ